MSENKYSLETEYNIWSDTFGNHFTVRPDCDGLNLVEIISYDENGKEEIRISFPKEAARLIVDAINKMLE